MSPRHSRPDSRRPSRFHARQQGPVDCKRKSGFYLKRPCPPLASTAGRASGPGRNPGDRRALREKRVGTAPGHGGRRHVKPAPPADPPAPARGRPLWSVPPTPSHPARTRPFPCPWSFLSPSPHAPGDAFLRHMCSCERGVHDGACWEGPWWDAAGCAGLSEQLRPGVGGFAQGCSYRRWLLALGGEVGRRPICRFSQLPRGKYSCHSSFTLSRDQAPQTPLQPADIHGDGTERIREPARGSVGRGPALRAAEAEPGLLQPGDTPRLRRQHVFYPGR